MRLDRGKEVQPDDARRVELCEEAREGVRLSGFAPRAGGQTKQSLTITAAQMRGPPPLRQLPPRAAGCCAALQSCPSAPYRRANEKYAPLLAAGTSHELSQFKLTQMGRALPHTYVPYKYCTGSLVLTALEIALIMSWVLKQNIKQQEPQA